MKDKLEQFVNEHKEEFDLLEPRADLWKGIDLPERRRFITAGLLWKAAIVIMIFGASLLANSYLKKDHERRSMAAAEKTINEIPELAEANKYYSGLIQAKLNEVHSELKSYPEINLNVNRDLSELDSIYNSLKNDLKDNISNPEIIEAMIQNYRLKLELLEQVLADLRSENQKNNPDAKNKARATKNI